MYNLTKIEHWLVQDNEDADICELLSKKGFEVNMRLYNENKEFRKTIRRMIKYMKNSITGATANFNACGMSGHNCGLPLNIIVVVKNFYSDNKIYFTLINPAILESATETHTKREGCGSVFGCRSGKSYTVTRPTCVKVSYYDYRGKHHIKTFTADLAEWIQHEVDHNNGITIKDIGELNIGFSL